MSKHLLHHFDRHGNCICPCSECFKAGECICPFCAEHLWLKGNPIDWWGVVLVSLLLIFTIIFVVKIY